MAGFVSRLAASFDRIPAVHAFVFMTVTGAAAGFALFGMGSTAALEIRPLGGFLLVLFLALVLVFFSRPVVVRRDNGPFVGRVLSGLRDFAKMVALQFAIFVVIIVPTFFLKFTSTATPDNRLNLLDSLPAQPFSKRRAISDAPPSLSVPVSAAQPISSTNAVPSIPTAPAPIATTSALKRPDVAPKPPPQPQ